MTAGAWCDGWLSASFWVRCSEQWGARLMDGLFTAEWRERGRASPVRRRRSTKNSEQSCWDGNALQPDMRRDRSYQLVLQDGNRDERRRRRIDLVRRCGNLIKGNKSSSPLPAFGQCEVQATDLENSFLFWRGFIWTRHYALDNTACEVDCLSMARNSVTGTRLHQHAVRLKCSYWGYW